jgi:enamine deaminase RidA (YjgF/YER057c/UK114 family)
MLDRFRDGGGWEEKAGYSRAVRRGPRIEVSGTTATGPDGRALCPGDTGGQTRAALERSLSAAEHLGGRRQDVIRTRVYLAPGADWEAAARVHAELLGDVAPANTTLFVQGLVGEGFLVEVEVEAHVTTPPPREGG